MNNIHNVIFPQIMVILLVVVVTYYLLPWHYIFCCPLVDDLSRTILVYFIGLHMQCFINGIFPNSTLIFVLNQPKKVHFKVGITKWVQ